MRTGSHTVDGKRKTVRVKTPAPELIGFLSAYDRRIQEMALALREMVLEEAPFASEIVFDANYTVVIAFTFSGRFKEAFCHISSHTHHVNLGFNRGTELRDPHDLLKGSGVLIRHISIADPADLKQPHLREYIQMAIDRALMLGGPVCTEPQVIVTVAKGGRRRPAARK